MKIEEFKFLYSVDRLAQLAIFRIYLNRIIPYSQKIIRSPWTVLQVYRSTKIIKFGKYLFQGSQQSCSTQFPD
jgi:hypothetical protein